MLGLTFDKILILSVIAVILLGPDRLPYYAQQLAALVRRGKAFLGAAQARARDELGPEFDEIDWKRLDPRQYDPRQIIRQALLDEPSIPGASAACAQNPTEPPPLSPPPTLSSTTPTGETERAR